MDVKKQLIIKINRSKMSCEQIGKNTGVSGQTIRNFINPDKDMELASSTLIRLCIIFGISHYYKEYKSKPNLESYLKGEYINNSPKYFVVYFMGIDVRITPISRYAQDSTYIVDDCDSQKLKDLEGELYQINDESYFIVVDSSDLYRKLRML